MKRFLITVFTLFTLVSLTEAQDKGMVVAKLDSLPELLQYYLTESTSKHFEDPKVPRFLLRDRSDNFVFGVGGAVKAKMFYDHQGNRGNFFELAKEDESSKYDNDVFDMNLHQTSLIFSVLGNTKIGVVDAVVSIDFGNSGGNPRLSQAYVDLLGLRIGKANTGFRDEESIKAIDFLSLGSQTARKVPQISYSHRFKSGIRAQAGFEFPQSASVWLKGEEKQISSFDILLPDLTANIFYTGKNIHLYGGVNGRIMNYYDMQETSVKIPTYAFQLGMNWAFVNTSAQTHKLFAQGIWTHGMADCCIGLRKKGLSAICDYSTGQYLVPNVGGGLLGYQVKFGDNTIDLAVSALCAKGHENAGIEDAFGSSCTGILNYFRKFLKYGTVGVEAVLGQRKDLSTKTYTNCRAYLYLQYDF